MNVNIYIYAGTLSVLMSTLSHVYRQKARFEKHMHKHTHSLTCRSVILVAKIDCKHQTKQAFNVYIIYPHTSTCTYIHTHTHAQTHSLRLSLSHTHTHTRISRVFYSRWLEQCVEYTHTHTHTHTCTHAFTTHTHTRTFAHSRSHTSSHTNRNTSCVSQLLHGAIHRM